MINAYFCRHHPFDFALSLETRPEGRASGKISPTMGCQLGPPGAHLDLAGAQLDLAGGQLDEAGLIQLQTSETQLDLAGQQKEPKQIYWRPAGSN